MFTKFHIVAAVAFVALGTSPAAAQQVCTSVPGYNNSVPGMAPGPYSLACGTATAYGEASTAVGQLATAPVSGGVAVGYDAMALGVNGVALGQGSNATAQNSVSVGQGSWADGTDGVAIGSGAQNWGYINSVAIGAWTHNTADNQVAVGDRTVSGVTAGDVSANSTEAVNGAQLFETNNRLAGLQSGMSAMDLRLEAIEDFAFDLGEGFERLDRKIDGSTAVAIAMSGNTFLPDKKVNITGNVGSYRGAWAGALQVAAMVSPNAALNAGIAKNFNRRGGVGTRAGFTFGW